MVSEPRALASGIGNKPQVKHACRKDTFVSSDNRKINTRYMPIYVQDIGI
jgi:hypothetical protein